MLRAFLELCRISNLPTVWTNVTAAWIVACFGMKWRIELLWLLIGASLVYCAGMILNDACDAAWDRDNRPERPIPSGRISLRTAWALGIGGLLGGYALMVFAGGAGPGITAALVGAIVLYDVYHKPWAGSVVVMGACRTLLYLAAGSAGLPDDNPWAWSALLASGLVMGFYIVGLSLVARHEAAPNKPGKLWFWIGLLALASPLAGELVGVVILYSRPGQFYIDVLAIALLRHVAWMISDATFGLSLLLLGLVGYTLRLMRTPPPSNIGKAVGWLLAGIPLVDAIAIGGEFPLCLLFVALVPLLRLWQRWIAAT